MQFNSLAYAIFLPLVFFIYWFIAGNNVKRQNLLLLMASYFFYGWWDWRFLGILVFTTLVDYFLAIRISRASSERNRKLWLALSLFMNLGLLCFFKYWNFFVDSWITAWASAGIQMNPLTVSVILPIGISFYTFQELSYTLDVYKKRMEPVRDLVGFAAFITFFPQLVAGPIEKASAFLPQFLKSRHFSAQQAIVGCRLILWGLVKKIVIADNLAVYVNDIYKNYDVLPGSVLLLGSALFAFQIYADFSGYSDIALGSAKLLGFDLVKNFNRPYISKSITEFWTRWHISLSSWFREYLYIPLGGNRVSIPRWSLNIMITFLVSGLWHGASFTFVIWGALHGLMILLERYFSLSFKFKAASGNWLLNAGLVLKTFTITTFIWIFFRATSIEQAFEIIHKIFTSFTVGSWNLNYLRAIWLIVFCIVIEYLSRKNEYVIFVPTRTMPSYLLFAIEIVLGLLVIDSSITLDHDQFIYFQF
ncbi:MAG: MBOAT family O-acyltransferase [Bacteroidota bacterium]